MLPSLKPIGVCALCGRRSVHRGCWREGAACWLSDSLGVPASGPKACSRRLPATLFREERAPRVRPGLFCTTHAAPWWSAPLQEGSQGPSCLCASAPRNALTVPTHCLDNALTPHALSIHCCREGSTAKVARVSLPRFPAQQCSQCSGCPHQCRLSLVSILMLQGELDGQGGQGLFAASPCPTMLSHCSRPSPRQRSGCPHQCRLSLVSILMLQGELDGQGGQVLGLPVAAPGR